MCLSSNFFFQLIRTSFIFPNVTNIWDIVSDALYFTIRAAEGVLKAKSYRNFVCTFGFCLCLWLTQIHFVVKKRYGCPPYLAICVVSFRGSCIPLFFGKCSTLIWQTSLTAAQLLTLCQHPF